ncbi:cytochrome aa3 quinol oxidase subunit IV [Litchfieldia alkalitelluris]|uniref:cytochrome aa3 quinol oxidase subunit IV n=1 Tax=Litchfieldia alkalitelluris TaxID=304268 RepID=UPI0009970170|nr:cytochrome aa3 quinol oxidase subunit IV [Litchfieldia alkalitelluris]
MKKHETGFPYRHVAGYLLSIIMTVLALIIAFKTDLSFNMIMLVIGALAILQAGLQLTMFMHVNEGESGTINVINMAYSIFLAVVIVAGTIWVLTSGHAAPIN